MPMNGSITQVLPSTKLNVLVATFVIKCLLGETPSKFITAGIQEKSPTSVKSA